MLKNSEMQKIQWLSKGQLSQERGKILFFHVFPVPDLSNLPHRVAQHDEILLQKLIEFSDSASSRNFSHLLLVRYSTLSPPLPSPFPMARHHATIRLFSTKSPSRFPAELQTSFHGLLCHLLQTQLPIPFSSVLSTTHTCLSGALPLLLCSEFGLLPSAAVCNSSILSKKISDNQDYLMLPSP